MTCDNVIDSRMIHATHENIYDGSFSNLSKDFEARRKYIMTHPLPNHNTTIISKPHRNDTNVCIRCHLGLCAGYEHNENSIRTFSESKQRLIFPNEVIVDNIVYKANHQILNDNHMDKEFEQPVSMSITIPLPNLIGKEIEILKNEHETDNSLLCRLVTSNKYSVDDPDIPLCEEVQNNAASLIDDNILLMFDSYSEYYEHPNGYNMIASFNHNGKYGLGWFNHMIEKDNGYLKWLMIHYPEIIKDTYMPNCTKETKKTLVYLHRDFLNKIVGGYNDDLADYRKVELALKNSIVDDDNNIQCILRSEVK